MDKHDVLLMLVTICFFSVAFKITIEDLSVHRILNVKKIYIVFSSKKTLRRLKKIKKAVLYYHNYKLPSITAD